MNIFVLDADPARAAIAHCDRHVVKMIVETAQMLSTAHHVLDHRPAIVGIYSPTHRGHQCSIWTREALGNYNWLLQLGQELCKEYSFRYGKVHKTQAVLERLATPPKFIEPFGLTPWAQAVGDEYKVPNNAILAYRRYYREAKAHLLTYRKRKPPIWLRDIEGDLL